MLKYFSNYLQVYLSTSIYVFIRNMKISLNIVSRDSMIFDWNVEFVQYISWNLEDLLGIFLRIWSNFVDTHQNIWSIPIRIKLECANGVPDITLQAITVRYCRWLKYEVRCQRLRQINTWKEIHDCQFTEIFSRLTMGLPILSYCLSACFFVDSVYAQVF